MAMGKSLYQRLLEGACVMDHHESDLYVLATERSYEVIRVWSEETGQRLQATSFVSEGRQWLDLPFMYDPFWRERAGPRERPRYRRASS